MPGTCCKVSSPTLTVRCYDRAMAWLPVFGALLVAVFTLAAVGIALRRRRARRRLADDRVASEELTAREEEAVASASEPAFEHPLLDADELLDGDELNEAYAIPLMAQHRDPSVHEKATREFKVALLVEESAPQTPAQAKSLHETPTREFAAYQDASGERDEITAQGAGELADLARSAFSDFSDDGERTCVYQPDAETLDTLRGLAASAGSSAARPVKSAPPPAPKAPPALSFGLPPPPRQMAERVRSLPPADRARSQSFYIQSNVQSEERVVRGVSARAPSPANDVRTSGFAPTTGAKTGARSADAQPARARNSGNK